MIFHLTGAGVTISDAEDLNAEKRNRFSQNLRFRFSEHYVFENMTQQRWHRNKGIIEIYYKEFPKIKALCIIAIRAPEK